ncbi:MAG: hypothetical protein WC798_00890 [Candidatus Paceibacterota bacterium]|jgi:hypothetical protein
MNPAPQANVEYFFRFLYNLIYGSHASLDYATFSSFATQLWLWIVIVGYALSVIGLFFIVYVTMRLFELRAREEQHYRTLLLAPDAVGKASPRWRHIESLVEGATASEWREAIIEADIMLDDLLTQQGYRGDGVGEKLKSVEPADFGALQDAWEAHKIRNQIAHEGSAFNLSETLARRTIAHYENVFREFGVI